MSLLSLLKPAHYLSCSAEDTLTLGEAFGQLAKTGDVLFLNGELGAGKTQFVKGIARALGITRPITSPTFTLENVYTDGSLELFHYDLYRLEDERELDDLDIFDISGTEGLTVIEWGAPYADAICPYRLELTLSRDLTKADSHRLIDGFALGERAETLLHRLDTKVSP